MTIFDDTVRGSNWWRSSHPTRIPLRRVPAAGGAAAENQQGRSGGSHHGEFSRHRAKKEPLLWHSSRDAAHTPDKRSDV
jgi:hypothetical protein